MTNPFIGVRIPLALNEAIAERMRETGQSKSEVVISALRSYLGLSSPHERLEAIEERLAALEAIATEVKSLKNVKHHAEYHPLPQDELLDI